MFAYCNNNPVNFVDSTGTCSHDGRFYTSGPFEGQFEYNPDCYLCAMHGEFWISDCNGTMYNLAQHEAHAFAQMAICTDGGENPHNSKTHQRETAYSIGGEYMDPVKVRYVVAPVGYANVKMGDFALVYDRATGKSVFAVIGDRGPQGKHNEVSLSVAWDLGYSWADGSRGPKGDFVILYFPGTKQKWSSVDTLIDYLGG